MSVTPVCDMTKAGTVRNSIRLLILLLTSLVLGSAPGCATEPEEAPTIFEGEIAYRIDLESHHPRLSEDYLRAQFGHGYTMVFKGGNYKETFEGGRVRAVWYRVDENKEYTLMDGEEVLRVADGNEIIPTPVGMDEVTGTRTIAGYRSSPLVVRFDDGSRTTFWYSPQLAVDPEWFRNFRLAGFHLFYPRSQAMILEYDRQLEIFSRKYVATKVTRRPVDDVELKMPDLPIRPFEDEAGN